MSRTTFKEICDKKAKGEKIIMLTAYDYPMAVILDQSDVDIVLVGDSLANVIMGLDSTKDVPMDVMLHHAQCVSRGVKRAMVIGDMPYEAYQLNPVVAFDNAERFVEEAGCDAVKIEWFDGCLGVVEEIVKSGIPVMGHVGLTPQTADKLGGMKVQGRDAQKAKDLIDNAIALEERGCFSIVCECIPDKVAEIITQKINVPTIGIGAGVGCDGQVLVTHDMLGLFDRYHPKFVKQYLKTNKLILDAVNKYCEDVKEGTFPAKEHTFIIKDDQLNALKKMIA